MRWIPGFLWVQIGIFPLHWQRPRFHYAKFGALVHDYALGPFWVATLR